MIKRKKINPSNPRPKARGLLMINTEGGVFFPRPKGRRLSAAECINLKNLKFDKQGLIPAIIQDYRNKEVLMLAYVNRESLRRSIKLGKTYFWSRSRKKYWVKGETSGNFQFIKSISYDCDQDALLIRVRQVGVACHTGNRSCFYRRVK
jgi:phosphoribosyl-AMP cyclohydrolase